VIGALRHRTTAWPLLIFAAVLAFQPLGALPAVAADPAKLSIETDLANLSSGDAALKAANQEFGDEGRKILSQLVSLRNNEIEIAQMERRLNELEAAHGASDPSLVPELRDLGALYAEAGADRADDYLTHLLRIDEAAYGAGDPRLLPALDALAPLRSRQGALVEAEGLYRRAVKIAAVDTREPWRQAIELDRLGEFLSVKGPNPETILLLRQALQVLDKTPPPSPLAEVSVLSDLAQALGSGNETSAERIRLLRRALALNQALFGDYGSSTHRALTDLMDNLADRAEVATLVKKAEVFEFEPAGRGNRAEALRLKELEKIEGPDSPDVRHAWLALASSSEIDGEVDSAEAIYRNELSVERKFLGEEIASTAEGLGRDLQGQGDLKSAAAVLREPYLTLKLTFGAMDTRTSAVAVYRNLLLSALPSAEAAAFLQSGVLAPASAVASESSAKIQSPPPSPPLLAGSPGTLPPPATAEDQQALLMSQAQAEADSRQYGPAEAHARQVLALQRAWIAQYNGPLVISKEGLNAELAPTLHLLAGVVRAQGRLDEAKSLDEESSAAQLKMAGVDPELTIKLANRDLTQSEHQFGARSLPAAAALVKLSVAYRLNHNAVSADESLVGAQAILTEGNAAAMAGTNHLLAADELVQIGKIYQDAGDDKKAEAAYRASIPLDPTFAFLDAGDPFVGIADILLKEQRLTEAETVLRSGPMGEPDASRLGSLLLKEGRYVEAEPVLKSAAEAAQSAAFFKDRYGPLLALADNERRLGELSAAETIYSGLVHTQGQIEGAGAANDELAAGGLAALLVDEDRLSEAEPILKAEIKQPLTVVEEEICPLDTDPPLQFVITGDPVPPLLQMSALLTAEGDHAGAIARAEAGLSLCERRFGPADVHIAETAIGLADALQGGGDKKTSEGLYTEAMRLREASFGANHSLTAEARLKLGTLLETEQRYGEAEPLLAGAAMSLDNQSAASTALAIVARGQLGRVRAIDLGELAAGYADLKRASDGVWARYGSVDTAMSNAEALQILTGARQIFRDQIDAAWALAHQ
jgi:hypothetical protein